jgi:hypothetical protein
LSLKTDTGDRGMKTDFFKDAKQPHIAQLSYPAGSLGRIGSMYRTVNLRYGRPVREGETPTVYRNRAAAKAAAQRAAVKHGGVPMTLVATI